VDTNVRHTWQLATDKFHVALSSCWLRTLAAILDGVCSGLGLVDDRRVEAQLYKLLLYEQGSFFKPHKDTEKVRAEPSIWVLRRFPDAGHSGTKPTLSGVFLSKVPANYTVRFSLFLSSSVFFFSLLLLLLQSS
jgi:hypothetical protein